MQWTDRARALFLVAALAGHVDAQPAPLTILDVPFISQSEALCGGAAAAMVLRYWGERGLSAESFSHLVDRSAAGIRTDALVSELRSRGWMAAALAGSGEAIDAELRRGRPVLTLIEDRPGRFHYIVIVARTPDAVVFHDPARAPLRVVGREEFERRWQPAKRWMAVVVPGERERETAAPVSALPSAEPCDALIAAGVARAQAGDLAAAEQHLTTALSCSGAAAMRELAGVRVLQRRWADVEALSSAATATDPGDAYGWRLLGTSRFVQNNRDGALAAWNRVSEPRLDLLSVAGLDRTRQRVVERLVDVKAGSVVTPNLLLRSERRLGELPAAVSTSLELRPAAGGLAELRATVNERPVFPADVWSYVALGAVAASRRELAAGTGSLTGGGERLKAEWRFWPGRPRLGVAVDAPAPWGGVWSVGGFGEHERFGDAGPPDEERAGGFVEWSTWTNAVVKITAGAGVEDWDRLGTLGRSGAQVQMLTRGSRVNVRADGEMWAGAASFSRVSVNIAAASSAARTGRVYLARGGAAAGSANLPPLLWFGGDTGQTRETLLRAHPLVDDGRLRIEQMGRRFWHASVEAQQWWSAGIVRTGAAVFVDAARVGDRADDDARGDVDAGVGVRLALPGAPGTFRADVATGLRHGGTRWSFVYDPQR
ncbi:MAG TPA: papain-like cysteine protease family protein [Vicinamibacterales bacterium]|nr:papain-like cysteine protease family protein [Vicinamibacterales bacterium]